MKGCYIIATTYLEAKMKTTYRGRQFTHEYKAQEASACIYSFFFGGGEGGERTDVSENVYKSQHLKHAVLNTSSMKNALGSQSSASRYRLKASSSSNLL